MKMAFAILSSLGQIDNLEKVINQEKIDLNKIDKADSSFLENLKGLLESVKIESDSHDGDKTSEFKGSIENLKKFLQEKELDKSDEAALLVLLSQIDLLDIEVPESTEVDIQFDSLMVLMENLDQLDIDEVMSEFDIDSLADISDIDDILSLELSDLDLENLDNDFIKLLQGFTEEEGIEFKLADLESQEAFTARLIEIISEEDVAELLARIKQEFAAEVRAMEIYADSNTTESSIFDKLQFEADRIVFEVREDKTELSDMASSKELDLNNILASNSKDFIESEESKLANELKENSSDSDGEIAKLVSKDLLSSDISEERQPGSEDKMDNLLKAMLADSDQVEKMAKNRQSQLTDQDSFAELIANGPGSGSSAETIELGNQVSFGLDQSVMEKLITEMDQFKQMGSNQLEMELEPSWLGKLRLNVSVEQGEVMARFLVDNNFIRHELENNIGLLKGSLARQGFNIEQISIETRDQQAGWQEGDNQNFADDFYNQDYNQDDSAFSFDQEELAYYAENMSDIKSIDPAEIDPRMRRWLSMKQYYNSMNLLA